MTKKKEKKDYQKQCVWDITYVRSGETHSAYIVSSCKKELAKDDIKNRYVLESEDDSIVSMEKFKELED